MCCAEAFSIIAILWDPSLVLDNEFAGANLYHSVVVHLHSVWAYIDFSEYKGVIMFIILTVAANFCYTAHTASISVFRILPCINSDLYAWRFCLAATEESRKLTQMNSTWRWLALDCIIAILSCCLRMGVFQTACVTAQSGLSISCWVERTFFSIPKQDYEFFFSFIGSPITIMQCFHRARIVVWVFLINNGYLASRYLSFLLVELL